MEPRRWLEMPLTQYVTLVAKLLGSHCEGHLVESYCKESNISDLNSLRYLFLIISDENLLSESRHHLTNLHI